MKKRFIMSKNDGSEKVCMVQEGAPIEASVSCEEEANGEELSVIYTVNNHLYFYRGITDESAALFNKTLNEMYFDLITAMVSSGLSGPTIEVHIKSSGGDATAAFAMVKKIKELQNGFGVIPVPVKVNTHIEGEACSAASLIGCVGSYRTISEYSVAMIHNGSGGYVGKPEEIEDYMTNYKVLIGNMRKIYKANSKLTDEILDAKLKNDLYFDAETCLRYGLVDEIV